MQAGLGDLNEPMKREKTPVTILISQLPIRFTVGTTGLYGVSPGWRIGELPDHPEGSL